MIDQRLLHYIKQHCNEYPDQEVCGVIAIHDGRRVYKRCKNTALIPQRCFRICPDELHAIQQRSQVIAIVHSHVGSVEPSQTDRAVAETTALPWVIVNAAGDYTILRPESYQTASFVGREFCWGVQDCWTLVRDWYQAELGITLPDAERPPIALWQINPLFAQWMDYGFTRTTDIAYGDIIAMAIGDSGQPTHAAVYLGNNRILHQVPNRLSSVDLYDGFWRNATQGVYRLCE